MNLKRKRLWKNKHNVIALLFMENCNPNSNISLLMDITKDVSYDSTRCITNSGCYGI